MKRVKDYNKPKQYKKHTTFRRKQTDAYTLIPANNTHASDNLTINRLSHLFKKTLKTYIPKYELSRLIKKYKNKRRGNKYVMRGGALPDNLETLITEYKVATEPEKAAKLTKITGLVSTGFDRGNDNTEYTSLIERIYIEGDETEKKQLLGLINSAFAPVKNTSNTIASVQQSLQSSVSAEANSSSEAQLAQEAAAQSQKGQSQQSVKNVSDTPVTDNVVEVNPTTIENTAAAQSTTPPVTKPPIAAAAAAAGKETSEAAKTSPESDDVIDSEEIKLTENSCKELLTALINHAAFSYVSVSKGSGEEQIKNKTNFMIGAIRYGRVPKKEEASPPAAASPPAGPAESTSEKSLLEYTMGESVSVAAGDPIIKGDGGVFINTPIDGTFNGGTAENIKISGIDNSTLGTITSKRVYKKGKQLEKAEDIPKDVTFADIRVEVNFPPDETDGSSPDLTQYLYNFTQNTSVKIKKNTRKLHFLKKIRTTIQNRQKKK